MKLTDNMNEITQFSPLAGKLVLEQVPGSIQGRKEAENDVKADSGADRTMYAYAPVSGCFDSKQTQVLMVLRDGDDEASAAEIMTALGLDRLAEEAHCLLLFPNPMPQSWNYNVDPSREEDMSFLNRCFASLRKSKVGINGFNGLTFYIGASPAACAMLMTFGAHKPLNTPAIMVSSLPKDYELPKDALNLSVAAWCSDERAAQYLIHANHVDLANGQDVENGNLYLSSENPNVRLLISHDTICEQTVWQAWEHVFSETRRWQNDTHGTYQVRTNFKERGFVGHVNDTSLGINNGFAHTWYEYIPPQLRGTQDKVPLLFYFHGGGCVPLYGAEQSCWHDVADKEGFIVIYPKASHNHAWNAWNDPTIPSDEQFMLALIDHIKTIHPIDDSRIYVSGFSMGSMMSNAMAAAHPELIAAAVPCNAYHEGYFSSRAFMEWRRANRGNPDAEVPDHITSTNSWVRETADRKKQEQDYRVPIMQVLGCLDGKWPITDKNDARLKTFDYWKAYNNIPVTEFSYDDSFESGLRADESFYDGDDQRFIHHRWLSRDEGTPSLYEVLLTKRMPHALDLRVPVMAWEFLSRFSRNPDGTLNIHR